jgi:hypothetical protein
MTAVTIGVCLRGGLGDTSLSLSLHDATAVISVTDKSCPHVLVKYPRHRAVRCDNWRAMMLRHAIGPVDRDGHSGQRVEFGIVRVDRPPRCALGGHQRTGCRAQTARRRIAVKPAPVWPAPQCSQVLRRHSASRPRSAHERSLRLSLLVAERSAEAFPPGPRVRRMRTGGVRYAFNVRGGDCLRRRVVACSDRPEPAEGAVYPGLFLTPTPSAWCRVGPLCKGPRNYEPIVWSLRFSCSRSFASGNRLLAPDRSSAGLLGAKHLTNFQHSPGGYRQRRSRQK